MRSQHVGQHSSATLLRESEEFWVNRAFARSLIFGLSPMHDIKARRLGSKLNKIKN